MKLCSDPIIAFFIFSARLKFYTLATIVDEIAARAEGARGLAIKSLKWKVINYKGLHIIESESFQLGKV